MKLTKNNLQDVFKSKQASEETLELKGYELIKEFFVDNSGFGSENEPALTKQQFINELYELISEHSQVYSYLTHIGQFQVYVGIFKKTGKSKCKRVAHNTLEINHANGDRSIRLYDTDIITYKSDGTIILSSGGFHTPTTKQRLNSFLPYGFIYQKNYEWFLKQGDKVTPFRDGMTI